MEADEEFIGDDYGVGLEGLGEGLVGVEEGFAVVGVLGGVDGFERDEQWVE